MPYAVVHDVPASWEQYTAVADALRGRVPDGLILHVAGRTDDGFRMIGVWETEDAWARFRAERLGPALTALEARARSRSVLRCLRLDHLVVSDRANTLDGGAPSPARRTRKETSCSDGSSPAQR